MANITIDRAARSVALRATRRALARQLTHPPSISSEAGVERACYVAWRRIEQYLATSPGDLLVGCLADDWAAGGWVDALLNERLVAALATELPPAP